MKRQLCQSSENQIMNEEERSTSDIIKDLPRYRCHKVVSAFKISKIENHSSFSFLTAENLLIPTLEVSSDYITKHKPQVGGYFVAYEDGYHSFSPAIAFESGYSKIED